MRRKFVQFALTISLRCTARNHSFVCKYHHGHWSTTAPATKARHHLQFQFARHKSRQGVMSPITLQQTGKNPKLFEILNTCIQSDSASSTITAAKSFSDSVDANSEDFFWDFWSDVFNVAEQIPHHHSAHDKLVAFLRELTLQPEKSDKVWDTRVWTDLPLLGAAIRQHLDKPYSSTQACLSFHSLVARLLHAGISPGSETTAIWMLRAALEQEKPGDDSDRDLMVAAMYIEYAGATLVQSLCLDPKPQLDETQQRMLKGGDLWKGESGLTVERWTFWGQRFARLGNDTTGEAKDAALHAAGLIDMWNTTRLNR
ncbi:hypothetical protein GGR57DRAFT_475667 [Xylariaceae sp. FL1272]|nr:hypothetical protein GGR57DRAFT_475667 [Xylariaceae sp. FL1272]